MRARSVLAVLAVLALIAAPAASATTKKKVTKPKVYCNLLTDPANDFTATAMPADKSAALDVLGGEFATGAKTVMATLKLGSVNVSPSNDPWSELGYDWKFGTQSTLGQTYAFTARTSLGNPITGSATVDNATIPGVKFTVDKVHNMFIWTFNRSAAPNLSRPKNIFHGFFAASNFLSDSADTTTATPPTDVYPDKGLHCSLHPA